MRWNEMESTATRFIPAALSRGITKGHWHARFRGVKRNNGRKINEKKGDLMYDQIETTHRQRVFGLHDVAVTFTSDGAGV